MFSRSSTHNRYTLRICQLAAFALRNRVDNKYNKSVPDEKDRHLLIRFGGF